jgi:hypothetical protein
MNNLAAVINNLSSAKRELLALDEVERRPPRIPYISNVKGRQDPGGNSGSNQRRQ